MAGPTTDWRKGMHKWTRTPRWLFAGIGISAVLGLAVALASGVSQAQVGPDDLKAPEGEPGLDVLACFAIENGETSPPPLMAVMTTDNFGSDVVRIADSPFFCESAVKTQHFGRDRDPAALPHGKLGGFVFQCFGVRNGANPDDLVRLISHNFDAEFVNIGPAEHMCETAHKTHGAVEFGRPGRMALHCFTVQQLAFEGIFPVHGNVELLTSNFGASLVQLGDTTILCEEASKQTGSPQNDIGRPTGRAWQCIEVVDEIIPEDPDRGAIDLETSNFGEMTELPVGALVMMCERAKKEFPITVTAFPGGGNP